MPTADDFDAAATAFDEQAHATRDLHVPLHRAAGAEVVRGGRLSADLGQFLESGAGTCDGVAASIAELAEDCRHRAAVCRTAEAEAAAYRRALRRHRSALSDWHLDLAAHEQDPDLPSPGTPPRAPRPPATPPPWVELRP